MSTFSQIVFSFGGIALRLFAILIILGQLYIIINAFMHKHRLWFRLLAAAQLLAGIVWLFLLLDGSFGKDYVVRDRAYPRLVSAVYASPWIVVLAVDLILAAICCMSLVRQVRYCRAHLSRIAVKETVDRLPAGLCFARSDGSVALKNQRMEELCVALSGKSLLDAAALREAVNNAGEAQDQARIVPLPQDTAMLFREEEITVDGEPFLQISAYDVSERYRIISELKANNKKLLDLQTRMKAFGARATELSMNEELLRARSTVHNEMGHLLLIGKNYLDDPSGTDEEKLILTQRYVHQLLMHEGEEQDSEGKSEIEKALDAARELGVSVRVIGDIPTGGAACEIIGDAVRECAANAVKHAAGDSLTLTLTRGEGSIRAVLHTDGSAPAGPITERGGLLNLRRRVESAGGTMTVTCEPGTVVRMTLPVS